MLATLGFGRELGVPRRRDLQQTAELLPPFCWAITSIVVLCSQ